MQRGCEVKEGGSSMNDLIESSGQIWFTNTLKLLAGIPNKTDLMYIHADRAGRQTVCRIKTAYTLRLCLYSL